MEESQRMQIASDIKNEKTDLNQSILLEPAGIIPFYTGLYTYDEVGLVNKRINDEMLKDENSWWINSVKRFKPDFILTVGAKAGGEKGFYPMKIDEQKYFHENYFMVKTYSIKKVQENAPKFLKWMYEIRPIGKDYYLYKKNR